jgi:hypothetical protein
VTLADVVTEVEAQASHSGWTARRYEFGIPMMNAARSWPSGSPWSAISAPRSRPT